jgi:hypothetical protein
MDQQTQPFYEFLGFQLDVGQRVLIRDGMRNLLLRTEFFRHINPIN